MWRWNLRIQAREFRQTAWISSSLRISPQKEFKLKEGDRIILGPVEHGGVVLSFAQWLVMRKQIKGAGLWIPANMLAWTFGMPVIFWGIDMAFKMSEIWQSVLLMAAILFLSGAIVGGIHGLFLVRLAERK